MKTRIFLYTVCIVLLAIFQSTLLDYITVLGVRPNLLLVFLVTMAFFQGNVEGATVGFFCGLAQDILTGRILGLYALLGLYTGLVAGMLNKRLYRENLLVVVFFTFTASGAYEAVVYLFTGFLQGQRDMLFSLRHIILPEMVYNSVVAILFYLPFVALHHKFEGLKKTAGKY